MQLSLGLGLNVASAIGSDALLDLDFAHSRYGFAGRAYPSKAAFLAAVGGASVGSAMLLGPYLSGSELIPDGGFAGGAIDGWASTASHTGNGSVSVVANQLVAAINSSTGSYRAARANAVTAGRAYRLAADIVAKGATPPLNSLSLNAALNSELGGSDGRLADFSVGAPIPQHLEVTAGAAGAGLHTGFVCAVGVSTPATVTLDNFSLREALPYPGHSPAGFAFRLAATTPPAASGNKVAVQWGTDGERFRVRLVWDASKHLRLVVTADNAEQANLDLGVVELSTPFSVEASLGPNRIAARLNGGASQLDSAAALPGIGRLWIGRSYTGEAWDGTLSRLSVWAAERLPDNMILAEGDSYVAGAGGVSLTASLGTALSGRPVVSRAVGGGTPMDVASRLAAIPGLARGVVVIWDGEMNTGSVVADQLAAYASIVGRIPHGRYLILPPCRRAGKSGADNANVALVQSALASLYAGRVIDAQAALAAHATAPGDNADIAGGYVPTSLLQGDLAHLTSAGMGHVAAVVATEIGARGW